MTTTANKIDPDDITTTNINAGNPAYDGSHADGQVSVASGLGTAAVTDKALTTNVATLTIPGGHPFIVGDSVLVGIGDSIFDGTKTLTAKTATSISYSQTHANVTGGPWTITNKALTSYLATLTCGTHNLVAGDTVTVSGLSGFNGTYKILSVTGTTITFRLTAADVVSAAASGTVTRISPIGTAAPTTYNERLTDNPALDVQQPAAVRILPSTGTVASGARW